MPTGMQSCRVPLVLSLALAYGTASILLALAVSSLVLAYGAASTLLALAASLLVLAYGTASTLLAVAALSLVLAYGTATTLLALAASLLVFAYAAPCTLFDLGVRRVPIFQEWTRTRHPEESSGLFVHLGRLAFLLIRKCVKIVVLRYGALECCSSVFFGAFVPPVIII